MFQTFDDDGGGADTAARLAALRGAMSEAGIDAFLVPRADAHQGEYVAPRDARLAWLTGFTGSAGIAAVTAEAAALFVDGRYRVQAREQSGAHIDIRPFPDERPGGWLTERLGAGARVGIDPWLHTRAEIEALREALPSDAAVVPVAVNPIDGIWRDQPAAPQGAVARYPEALAGRSAADKRAAIAETLRGGGQRFAILTLPDSIAWLLNIRGSDIERIPVAQAFAILDAEDGGVRLFIDAAKMGELVLPGVSVFPQDALIQAVSTLAGPVRLDRDTAPHAIGAALEEAGIRVDWAPDPCLLPKARKTAAEIDGARAAHLRDGAAMATFLSWLDARLAAGARLTEIDIVRRLEEARRATGHLRDIAFETIAGSGPHGALPHYRVGTASNRTIAPGDLLLVDSGGQYEDGTTDVTRTVPVGPPGGDRIDAFTRVLQGLIAISTARWPRGLAGRDLDPLARAALWRAGLDYDHGTGHGVGAFLSVHEGPQRLSRSSEIPLEPGMILSNEPGYYREGAFGIRLETLVVVREAPRAGDGRDQLCFETLTYVPLDRRLIDAGALARHERDWLDTYHAETHARIAPLVDADTARWLDAACAPL